MRDGAIIREARSAGENGKLSRDDDRSRSSEATKSRSKPRVLLAEDEPLTRALLHDWLSERDFDVLAFEDGSRARSFLRTFAERGTWPAIDLVFTDLAMPEVSGIELLRYIHSVRPQIPVVLMTAFADLASRAEASELGAAAYLEKPIDLEQLAAVTTAVLSAPAAVSASSEWRSAEGNPEEIRA